jgi:nicotinamidase-related amidase
VNPPSFYDPARVADLFGERAAAIAEAARGVPPAPARGDRERIAMFGIDCQVAFCTPGASLFVPGAVEDTRRAIEWLYRNLERITSLFFSLDTHSVHQIFHPAAWRDAAGRAPEPFTVITARDVRDGPWIPLLGEDPEPRAEALEYCERLEATGKYLLTIWPYHALLGGVSHALVPALMEAALFHAMVRGVDPRFEIKGRAVMTENFSVLAPEVRELRGRTLGAFNTSLFDALLAHDRVYVFGQAKSHCVLATLEDLRAECERRERSLLGRIHILEDAMSPVPPPPLDPLPEALDFPKVAERAIERFRAAGMHVVRTNDSI